MIVVSSHYAGRMFGVNTAAVWPVWRFGRRRCGCRLGPSGLGKIQLEGGKDSGQSRTPWENIRLCRLRQDVALAGGPDPGFLGVVGTGATAFDGGHHVRDD